jgi:hypothetical protein
VVDHKARFAAAVLFVACFAATFGPSPVDAQSGSIARRSERERDQDPRISPAQRIRRGERAPSDRSVPRPLDGFGNHQRDPEMNAANTPLMRYLPGDYADGSAAMAGPARPTPRLISNIVFAQDRDRPNAVGASDFIWQWGQFLDHDLDLTEGTDPRESFPILIPDDDPHFPGGTGMDFNRSLYVVDRDGVRQQVNEITGWIDGSMVYGSDDERSRALRTLDGTGRLKTGPGNLLPQNDAGLPNAGGDSAALFLAGDVRANEQAGLTAIHTLFVREHNRWANILRAEAQADSDDDARPQRRSQRIYRHRDPNGNWVFSDRPQPGSSREAGETLETGARRARPLTGDEIFERAREIVIGEIQRITYEEFLPVLLGPYAMRPYGGHRPSADARIMNEFSAAAFRLGHSMLSPTLLRLDPNGDPIPAGHLELRDAFFAPHAIREYGIEPLLRGLSQQPAQEVDAYVVDDVRNFLFGGPGMGGFDLVSLNIQRGRDHGLPSYNDARRALGLRPARDFRDISRDPETVRRLSRAYGSVEDVDLWVGGIAEDHYRGGMVGELFHTLVRQQFETLRSGDRLWYTSVLSPRDRERVEALRLADIIRHNTPIEDEIQDDVFRVRSRGSRGSDRSRAQSAQLRQEGEAQRQAD